MVRKEQKKREKIRVLKKDSFFGGIIVFYKLYGGCISIENTRIYNYKNIVSHTTENEGIEERFAKNVKIMILRIKDIVEIKVSTQKNFWN